jgi:hypothetical protein
VTLPSHNRGNRFWQSRANVPADHACAIVRELVLAEPPPIKRAMEVVGQALGMAPSTVRKYWSGWVSQIPASRDALIRERHAAALQDKMARLDAERAAIEAQLNALRGTAGHAEDRCMDALSGGAGLRRRRTDVLPDGEAVS